MQVKTVKPFGKKIRKDDIRISICDKNPDIVNVFARLFVEEERVEILKGDILNLTADALISPANSFGDMSGGLDKAIDDFFVGEAQRKVQEHINHAFFGEIPVGVASVIEMNYRQFPFLIIAPTMRVPSNVGKSINAYLAMRAILVAVLQHNSTVANEKINHIVLPSLCTGVGGMPFQEAAEQIYTAILTILDNKWKSIVHPAVAPYALGARWVMSEKRDKFKNKD